MKRTLSYAVVTLALLVLLLPQSSIDAATGRIANLLATSRVVGSAIGLDVSVVDGSGNQVTSFGGDTEMPAAVTLGDNTANPTVPGVASFSMCWDGATWDRCSGTSADTELPAAAAITDNEANPTVPRVGAMLMCWDGSTWDRCPSATTTELTHDATAPTWTAVIGGVTMGRASATAPTDVGANEPVAPWHFLNGAQAAVPVAATSGGCTPNSIRSVASVNETEVKATPGQLYVVVVSNRNAADRYIKFYNDTAANTDETDTPTWRFLIPGASGGYVLPIPVGATFSTAITFRLTTGDADTDTGAVSAGEHFVNWCFK